LIFPSLYPSAFLPFSFQITASGAAGYREPTLIYPNENENRFDQHTQKY
jgi:hypothetical protein